MLPTRSYDQRSEVADVEPFVLRIALSYAATNDINIRRLCKGLGFGSEQLQSTEFHVSYRQTASFLRRLRKAVGENHSLGLRLGMIETPVSMGLAGLAMFACPTFGDAVQFAMAHQNNVGGLLNVSFTATDGLLMFEAVPRFHDPELEPTLVEEAFSGMLSIGRVIVGDRLTPRSIEIRYREPEYASEYSVFGCSVRFGADANRLTLDSKWLSQPLSTYEPINGSMLLQQIAQFLKPMSERNYLVESVTALIRSRLDGSIALDEVAAELAISSRTLRRRLSDSGVKFQELVDRARLAEAMNLLNSSDMPITEISSRVGFQDPSNFRRAFKRWTGQAPNQLRSAK